MFWGGRGVRMYVLGNQLLTARFKLGFGVVVHDTVCGKGDDKMMHMSQRARF